MESDQSKTAQYPRWLLLWFGVSLVVAVLSGLLLGVALLLDSYPLKLAMFLSSAVAGLNLSWTIFKGDSYA